MPPVSLFLFQPIDLPFSLPPLMCMGHRSIGSREGERGRDPPADSRRRGQSSGATRSYNSARGHAAQAQDLERHEGAPQEGTPGTRRRPEQIGREPHSYRRRRNWTPGDRRGSGNFLLMYLHSESWRRRGGQHPCRNYRGWVQVIAIWSKPVFSRDSPYPRAATKQSLPQ